MHWNVFIWKNEVYLRLLNTLVVCPRLRDISSAEQIWKNNGVKIADSDFRFYLNSNINSSIKMDNKLVFLFVNARSQTGNQANQNSRTCRIIYYMGTF